MFIVRFLPLVLFLVLGDVLADSWRGISQYPFNLLHSNSVFYALALFFVSLADRKYHCVWNRVMYAELAVFPLINYIDAKTGLFPDVRTLLAVLTATWVVAAAATVFLAAGHFVLVSRKRRRNHGK